MNLANTIASGVVGTTAMTTFSYCLSELKDNNFKEPRLLADMLVKVMPAGNRSGTVKIGWVLHYLVGIFFAALYKRILRKQRLSHPVLTGSMAGALTGIFAVMVWKTVFILHPFPPLINYKKFYRQLITAHIIFGAVSIFFLNSHNKDRFKVSTSERSSSPQLSNGACNN